MCRHSLLQGIFLTQESNLGLLHCGQILYHLSHQGSPSQFENVSSTPKETVPKHHSLYPSSPHPASLHSPALSQSVQSCPTLFDPINRSMPGLPVHHQLLELTQTHVHQVGDAIQPSHLLSSPSPSAFNLFQNQGLFQ